MQRIFTLALPVLALVFVAHDVILVTKSAIASIGTNNLIILYILHHP